MKSINIVHNFLDENLIIYFDLCFKSKPEYEVIQLLNSDKVMSAYSNENVYTKTIYESTQLKIDYVDTKPVSKLIVSCGDAGHLEEYLKTFRSDLLDSINLVNRCSEYNEYLKTLYGYTINYPSTRYVYTTKSYSTVVAFCSLLCSVLGIEYTTCSFDIKVLPIDEPDCISDNYINLFNRMWYRIYELPQGGSYLEILCDGFFNQLLSHVMGMCEDCEEALSIDRLCFIRKRNIMISFY